MAHLRVDASDQLEAEVERHSYLSVLSHHLVYLLDFLVLGILPNGQELFHRALKLPSAADLASNRRAPILAVVLRKNWAHLTLVDDEIAYCRSSSLALHLCSPLVPQLHECHVHLLVCARRAHLALQHFLLD